MLVIVVAKVGLWWVISRISCNIIIIILRRGAIITHQQNTRKISSMLIITLTTTALIVHHHQISSTHSFISLQSTVSYWSTHSTNYYSISRAKANKSITTKNKSEPYLIINKSSQMQSSATTMILSFKMRIMVRHMLHIASVRIEKLLWGGWLVIMLTNFIK